jgi:phage anti-repressor protein
MLNINENNRISGKEIYSTIESRNKNYSDWIRKAIKRADLQKDKDFLAIPLKSTGGRPEVIIEFTIESAKEICLLEQNEKGKQIRRWLISLSEQKENYDLLTHQQVIYLNILKSFFKFIENQKIYLEKHLNLYVQKHNEKSFKNPYAEFHLWRNKLLEIDGFKLDTMIKKYCIDNEKKLPKIKSIFEKLRYLNEYDTLRNAVWDFLSIKGEVNALKLANLVRKMAESENLVIYDHNENNLFQYKEDIKEPKMISK